MNFIVGILNFLYWRILEMPQIEILLYQFYYFKLFAGCFYAWGHTIKNLEMPQNRTYSFSESDGRNDFSQFGHFISNIKKWGISRKNHVLVLKTRKKPEMNMFDFGAFQDIWAYALTCKKSFSGAFQGTSRIYLYTVLTFSKRSIKRPIFWKDTMKTGFRQFNQKLKKGEKSASSELHHA